LGVKVLEFNAAIRRNLKIGEVGQPSLRELTESSGEYTEMAIVESDTPVTIARFEVKHNLRILNVIGERLPLHATAVIKIRLFWLYAGPRVWGEQLRRLGLAGKLKATVPIFSSAGNFGSQNCTSLEVDRQVQLAECSRSCMQ
jgi:hypothetical protein